MGRTIKILQITGGMECRFWADGSEGRDRGKDQREADCCHENFPLVHVRVPVNLHNPHDCHGDACQNLRGSIDNHVSTSKKKFWGWGWGWIVGDGHRKGDACRAACVP